MDTAAEAGADVAAAVVAGIAADAVAAVVRTEYESFVVAYYAVQAVHDHV